MDARRQGAALRRKRDDGASILIATASTRDARDLAEEVLLFARGALVHRAPSGDPRRVGNARGFRLDVVASDAGALLGELAREPSIAEATRDPAGRLALQGPDALAMARAVARAVSASGVVLESMRLVPLSLEDARAASPPPGGAVIALARLPLGAWPALRAGGWPWRSGAPSP